MYDAKITSNALGWRVIVWHFSCAILCIALRKFS